MFGAFGWSAHALVLLVFGACETPPVTTIIDSEGFRFATKSGFDEARRQLAVQCAAARTALWSVMALSGAAETERQMARAADAIALARSNRGTGAREIQSLAGALVYFGRIDEAVASCQRFSPRRQAGRVNFASVEDRRLVIHPRDVEAERAETGF